MVPSLCFGLFISLRKWYVFLKAWFILRTNPVGLLAENRTVKGPRSWRNGRCRDVFRALSRRWVSYARPPQLWTVRFSWLYRRRSESPKAHFQRLAEMHTIISSLSPCHRSQNAIVHSKELLSSNVRASCVNVCFMLLPRRMFCTGEQVLLSKKRKIHVQCRHTCIMAEKHRLNSSIPQILVSDWKIRQY